MRAALIAGLWLLGSAFAQSEADADPVLTLARRAAAEYGTSLPNYVCQESMERYNVVPNNFRAQPRHLDTVLAEVVYENGKENFRNLRVNGRPAAQAAGGIWSIGVFGPLMASVFDPRLAAEFRRRDTGHEGGRAVVRYDFTVPEAKSNWVITNFVRGAEVKAKPGYHGSIWIEISSGRILRHEIETGKMPPAFYYQEASLKVRYRFVKINSQEYLLPQTTESRLCPRGFLYCDRVDATYSDCHKFSAESSLKFDAE